MGNFSKDPDHALRRERERGYVGARIEQGVPLLDRDLNLLAGLVAESVREILGRHLGDGVAERNDAFAVEPLATPGDFRIAAPPGGGALLVGGIEARIDTSLRYLEQPDVPPLTVPEREARTDLVYLDLWVEEVGADVDPELENASDVGVRTSVRLRPAWRARVAEGTRELPPASAGHAHTPLAMLERRPGEAVIGERTIVDLRRTGLNLAEIARRVQRLEDVLLSPAPGWPATAAPPAGDATGPAERRREHAR